MSNVNAEVKWQGNNDAWFTANASTVYDANIQIFHIDGRYKFTDGVTTLGDLPFLGSGGGNQDLQSVTDNGNTTTNPINVIDNGINLSATSGNKQIDMTNEYLTIQDGIVLLFRADLVTGTLQKNNVDIATVNDIVNVDVNTIGSAINGAASATPNDTDLVMSVESSVAKKNTWTEVKAFLKSYFDTVYTTTSEVATQITTALSGYATQAWVTSQGYISNVKTVGGVSIVGSGDVSTPTFTNPVVGTQTQGDNSTKAASTSYVDTAISNITVRRIHNCQNTDSTTTGSTSETVLANLKVTGGIMGANGVLTIDAFLCKSGTAGSVTWKFYVSTVNTNTVGNTGVPTSATQISSASHSASSLTGGRYARKMVNKNSASAQLMLPTAVTALTDYSGTSIARNSININTGNDFHLVVTATLANSGDTAILSDIQLNIDKP